MINQRGARTLENCPGFEPMSDAEEWIFSFLRRASQAEHACTWPKGVEFAYLEEAGDATVDDLVEAASRAAEAWSEATRSLKEYQEKREAIESGDSSSLASATKSEDLRATFKSERWK